MDQEWKSRCNPSSEQHWVHYYRIVQISLTCTCFLFNIVVIIKNKQYVYSTIKLFLCMLIFFFISMIIVVPHSSSFNSSVSEDINSIEPKDKNNTNYKNYCFQTLLKGQSTQSKVLCATEAYINLVSYNITYVFAVLITFYIRKILDNDHKKFIKKQIKGISIVISLIVIWYIFPLVLTFAKPQPLMSFGPSGFRVFSDKYEFYYCGIVERGDPAEKDVQPLAKFLSIFWMFAIPFSLFIIHSILLYRNFKSHKKLLQLQELNPRQYFIIKSGKLSFIIFLVQAINFAKFVLQSVDDSVIGGINTIINLIFDSLGILLVYFYFKFYHQEGKSLNHSRMLFSNSDSLITTTSPIA